MNTLAFTFNGWHFALIVSLIVSFVVFLEITKEDRKNPNPTGLNYLSGLTYLFAFPVCFILATIVLSVRGFIAIFFE